MTENREREERHEQRAQYAIVVRHVQTSLLASSCWPPTAPQSTEEVGS